VLSLAAAAVAASSKPPETIPVLQAIVLGITQGLAEFLPISSSGHLILVPWLFGWTGLGAAGADFNRTFDVALHLGTLGGLVAYFHRDLARVAVAGGRALLKRRAESNDERLAGLLVVATVPGVIAGAALDATVLGRLGSIALIAIMLIAFGLVLAVADRALGRRELGSLGLRDALIMGGAQALALSPGVSRSGATISAGRFLGLSRDAAARMSFLMSVPITAGALVYEGAKLVANGGLPAGTAPAFLWGIVSSALTGVVAVWLVLRIVRTRSFRPFVIYRVVAGAGVLVLLALR